MGGGGTLFLTFFTLVFNEKRSQSDAASQASGSSVFLSSPGTDVVLVVNNRVLFLKDKGCRVERCKNFF